MTNIHSKVPPLPGAEIGDGLGSSNHSEVTYYREPLTDGLIAEVAPLLAEHWEEVAHYKDIPLDVDWALYRAMWDRGAIRIFTVRDADHELIGYSAFFVHPNPHYRMLQAVNDVIFIRKERRGGGRKFIEWCDERLREEGVRVAYHHVKAAHDWTPMLKRMGYELQDLICSRRLDR